MAAKFDPELSRIVDHVRQRLSDTGVFSWGGTGTGPVDITAGAYFQDETITKNVQVYGYNEAVAIMAESMATYYASQEPDKLTQANGTTVTFAERVDQLMNIAKQQRFAGVDPTQTPTSKPTFYPSGSIDNIPNF